MLRSLKIKFILLLLLGGTVAGVIGLWLTHEAANKELDERLRVRAETLASAINHTAMVRSSWSTIQHVIDEIVREQHRAQQATDVAPAAGHLHASSPGEYRGAILVRVSRAATSRSAFAIDRQYAGGILASILVILLVALVTLKHLVLTPLQSIRNVIDRRNAGDTEARITLDRKDELAAVAQALNATLDKGDE